MDSEGQIRTGDDDLHILLTHPGGLVTLHPMKNTPRPESARQRSRPWGLSIDGNFAGHHRSTNSGSSWGGQILE